MYFKRGKYKNKKTKNYYFAERIVKNATNINDGDIMVLYYRYFNNNILYDEGYVRNYSEFIEKFELAED